jgi:hypothetical protein
MNPADLPQPNRRLRIDLGDLEQAFEGGPDQANSFLDLETGRVITITDDTRSDYNRLCKAVGEVDANQWDAAFEAALERMDFHDWERELLRDADRVEQTFPGLCLRVPAIDSRDGYSDMEAFIETVTNPRVSDSLWRAISGQRPFRAFKDVLGAYPKELERWFAFKDALVSERVLEWLEAEGIELLDDDLAGRGQV